MCNILKRLIVTCYIVDSRPHMIEVITSCSGNAFLGFHDDVMGMFMNLRAMGFIVSCGVMMWW